MALRDVYLLPPLILADIDLLIKNETITARNVFYMIKQRYHKRLRFNIKTLQEYIDTERSFMSPATLQEYENRTLLPVTVGNNIGNSQVNDGDTAISVDIRNHGKVIEYFKKMVMSRVGVIRDRMLPNQNVDPYIEALLINYTRTMTELIEKEIKLELEIEESTKLDKLVAERLNLALMLIGSVVKKHVGKDKFNLIQKELKARFESYGKDIE